MALSKILPASQEQYVGARNLIINGNMAVWQRGVTVDSIVSNTYLCDRWRVGHVGTDGNLDVDRDTSVPTGKGFSFSHKMSMDASETSLDAGDHVNVHQRFEAQNIRNSGWDYTSASSYLTLSFWVRSSVASTYSVEFGAIDGTAKMIGRTYVINSADTWEYKKVTISGDAGLTIDNDNGHGFDLRFWIDAGSTWTSGTFATSWENTTSANRVSQTTGWLESTSPEFYITGTQLEVGSATPFEHEPFAVTQQKCQRYYFAGDGSQMWNFTGGSIAVSIPFEFPVQMRSAPTVTDTNSTARGSIAVNGFSAYKGAIGSGGNWRMTGITADAEL